MLIRFAENLDLIKSREGGRLAKQKFELLFSIATTTNPVIFDFEGVSSISSSFADEFFGKQIRDMGFTEFKSITTFKNLTPFVSNVIRNSIYSRNADSFATSR